MKTYRIATLPGDGIGPEVTAEAVKVLQALAPSLQDVRFEFQEYSVGAAEYLRSGDPMPPQTFEAIQSHDAILLGAMGLPDVRWPGGTEMAPQLDLREQLDLYCGLRPVYLYDPAHSPLKAHAAGEIDFVIVRENTEGLFYSRKNFYTPGAVEVVDSLRISRHGAERLFRAAFREAAGRRHRVTLVDKANVLPSMAYFRQIFDEVSGEFPEIEPEKIYIDAASLYLVQRPHTFDVIVTENLFGDILSDLAAGLVGGMGLAPSADIGERHAVFQPSHGSAPDIAGRGIANPVAAILSAAMMLEWLAHPETLRGAAAIHDAVRSVLDAAKPENRTRDLGGSLSTSEMGDRIVAALSR
jgi:3-isopropylmalate dehydrogenase